MNSIVQNPTPKDSEGFFLCGGTLTTLLLRARKTQGDNKPKEMFSEPETFAALVEAITGYKWSPEMRTLQGMTSNYRNCSASVSSIPLEDASIAAQYDTAVQYDFSTINKRMEDFVTDHLDPFRASIFVKSVIELIRDDSSIPLGQFFFMNGSDRPTTKHQLEVQCEVAIAPFLVGIWHFILMNRRGKNALGLSTLNKWGPKVKSRPRDLSQYPFGASILHDVVVEFPKKDVSPVVEYQDFRDYPAQTTCDPLERYMHSIRKYYGCVYTVLAPSYPVYLEDIYTSADLLPLSKVGRLQHTRISNPTIKELESYNRHIRITGTGGIGKTIHMRHWLFECLNAYPNTGRVPIFIEPKSYRLSDNSLMEYIIRCMQQHADDLPLSDVQALIRSESCIIFFDGADEMSADEREQFINQLDDFIRLYPDITIVLSARTSYYTSNYLGFAAYEIQKLSKAQAVELIRRVNYWDEDEKRRFIKTLESRLYDTHREVCGIPLLLVILLATYKSYGDVPSDLYKFLEKAYSTLLILHDRLKHGFTRRMYCGLESEEFTPYFAAFCFQAYSKSQLDFSKSCFIELMSKAMEKRPLRTGAQPISFLYDAIDGVCLMYEEAEEYHFIHRSFIEYLTAVHLSENIAGKYDYIRRYFDEEKHGWDGDSTFEMLYAMRKDDLDVYLFYPLFSALLSKYGTDDDGYWRFICDKYPLLSVQNIPFEEIASEESPALQEWVDSLKLTRHSNSFLYNFFIHANGLSHVEEIDEYDWQDSDIALFGGDFIIRDAPRDSWGNRIGQKSLRLYDSKANEPHIPADLSPQDKRGFVFTLCTKQLDDDGDGTSLYYRMTEADFPLRAEFNAICKWVEDMQHRLEEAEKYNSITAALA